ncbi:hypothetical protein EYZ11_012410 [Aspergillus tanneri]|uniref:Uncharacterized protein n=1 Tax=Aspergillus tanneri TaxID=1220188 RepID=A0A4S3J5Q0_9EURO|nr:hypothetical protein EYZ11_012410 [Aspergillus tanneri]
MEVILTCFLCRLPLNPSHTQHYVLQETVQNGIGAGKLLLRDRMNEFNSRSYDLQALTVHCGCWSIAERALQLKSFSQHWLDRFSRYLFNLSPFLIQIPFAYQAGDLDADLFVVMDDNDERAVSRGQFPVPLAPELTQRIYDFLDQEEDVVNLSEVLRYGPSPRRWKELGRKYDLEDGANCEVNVRTIAKKIMRNPPGRYPRTANYRTIWDNVRMVATAMEQTVNLVQVPRHMYVPYAAVLDRSLPKLAKRYALPTKDVSQLTFTFDGSILSGIILNGILVGYKGQTWSSVRVNSIKGLHIAAVGGRFVAIQVKDSNGWQLQWHGLPPTNGTFSRLEWKSSRTELLISYDKDKKMIELACRIDIDQHVLFPTTQVPVDLSLTLSCLYDRHKRSHGLYPLWTFTTDFRQVTAVNAYMNPVWGQFAVSALEFVCKDTVHLLGPSITSDVKLSFLLLPDETITTVSVGSAPDDGNLALTFTTNKNRSVTFGDPSAEISHSVANVAGIAIGKSLLDHHMSAFGIFQSPQRPVVHPLRDKVAGNHQYWTSTVIPSIPPFMGLQSTAPLNAISMIQAFQATALGPVTGLLLFYRDRCPSALGELTIRSATHTLEPGEDIQGIAISYLSDESGHRIYCIELLNTAKGRKLSSLDLLRPCKFSLAFTDFCLRQCTWDPGNMEKYLLLV